MYVTCGMTRTDDDDDCRSLIQWYHQPQNGSVCSYKKKDLNKSTSNIICIQFGVSMEHVWNTEQNWNLNKVHCKSSLACRLPRTEKQ